MGSTCNRYHARLILCFIHTRANWDMSDSALANYSTESMPVPVIPTWFPSAPLPSLASILFFFFPPPPPPPLPSSLSLPPLDPAAPLLRQSANTKKIIIVTAAQRAGSFKIHSLLGPSRAPLTSSLDKRCPTDLCHASWLTLHHPYNLLALRFSSRRDRRGRGGGNGL